MNITATTNVQCVGQNLTTISNVSVITDIDAVVDNIVENNKYEPTENKIVQNSGTYTSTGTNQFTAKGASGLICSMECTVDTIVEYNKINYPNEKALISDFMLNDNSVTSNNGVWKEIRNDLNDVYLGKSSIEDLSKKFSDIYDKLYKKNVEIGMFKEGDSDAEKYLVGKLYGEFAKQNVWAAGGNSYQTADKMAENYGGVNWIDGTPFDVDYLYYSADDYYNSKNIEQGLKDVVSTICNKCNINQIDTDIIDSERLGSNKDYNSWYQSVCQSLRISSMVDTSQEPPKGFDFFYQAHKFSEKALSCGKTYTITAFDGQAYNSRQINVPEGYSLYNKGLQKSLLDYILDDSNYRQSVINDKGRITNGIDISSFFANTNNSSEISEKFDEFCDKYLFNDQSAVAVVGYNGITKEITVPYNIYTINERKDHYNLSQLVQVDKTETESTDKINSFLKNFNVFESQYGIFNYYKYK